MKKPFKYIELFAGIGGFGLAMNNVFENAKCVAWSEIDKYAIQVFNENFPQYKKINFGNIERLVFDTKEVTRKGEKKTMFIVNEFRVNMLPDADIIVGGSSCQDLSIAKANRTGLKGANSRVFFAFLEIIKIKKPKYFILENVASMSKENRDKISKLLGVEPVKICSDKFTPQKRNRLYWTNINIPELPKRNGPRWKNLVAWSSSNDYDKNGKHLGKRERETRDGRANTLTTGQGCASYSSKNFILEYSKNLKVNLARELNPVECERLQSFPDHWTDGVSASQRYKQLGNAVTVNVIEHILRGIK